jgi:glycerate dehydrogenase
VDESALAKELDKREIYAGLDVCSKEPLPKDSPLLSLKYPQRVIITPHIAWTSIESRKRLLDGIVKNIEEFTE